MRTDRSNESRAALFRGLIIAGVLIGITAVLRFLTPMHVSPETARRALGALMGAVVVVYANEVPKALTPLVRMRCEPAVEQAMRRFTGWSLVLGGMSYSLAWLIAPLGNANLLAASLLATSLLFVVLRIARARSGRFRS
jgi:hypothetical protein